jgi:hypothetical protein
LNNKQEQRWRGDWEPGGQANRAWGTTRDWARHLALALLSYDDADPMRVLAVVTETFGEVGREETLAVIEERARH